MMSHYKDISTISTLVSSSPWHGTILIDLKKILVVKAFITESNGIAVQSKVVGPMSQCIMPAVIKSKKGSISPAPLLLSTYNVGKRSCPPKTETLDADTTKEVHDAKIKNHIILDPDTTVSP